MCTAKARESISGWGSGVGVGAAHPHILLSSPENAPPTPPCNLQERWHDISRPSFLLRILWSCWLVNVHSHPQNPRSQSPRDVPAISVVFLFGALSCRLADMGVEREVLATALRLKISWIERSLSARAPSFWSVLESVLASSLC